MLRSRPIRHGFDVAMNYDRARTLIPCQMSAMQMRGPTSCSNSPLQAVSRCSYRACAAGAQHLSYVCAWLLRDICHAVKEHNMPCARFGCRSLEPQLRGVLAWQSVQGILYTFTATLGTQSSAWRNGSSLLLKPSLRLSCPCGCSRTSQTQRASVATSKLGLWLLQPLLTAAGTSLCRDLRAQVVAGTLQPPCTLINAEAVRTNRFHQQQLQQYLVLCISPSSLLPCRPWACLQCIWLPTSRC
jgi:hypothetical protein